jgi:hypothetical protein
MHRLIRRWRRGRERAVATGTAWVREIVIVTFLASLFLAGFLVWATDRVWQ